jgi:uncharacterized protein with von Willebrand factor type A (vWA) domain
MSVVMIKAIHKLEASCMHCGDRTELDVTSTYGDGIVRRVAEFEERHKACLEKLEAAARERERASKATALKSSA